MARILVVSDDGSVVVQVVTDDEGTTVANCQLGCEPITDRGQFGDTAQAAVVHADGH